MASRPAPSEPDDHGPDDHGPDDHGPDDHGPDDHGPEVRAGVEPQQALADLALELASERSFRDLLQLVTDRAREIIGAEMAVTSQTTGEDWTQVVTAQSFSERFAEYRGFVASPDGSGIYRLVCRENRPMRLTQSEVEAHPAFGGFGRHRGSHPPLRGWVAAPLVARDGGNLGVIQLSHKREGEFGARDEAMLVQVAQMAAAVIADRLLRVQLEERVQQLDESLAALRGLHEDRRRLLGRIVASQEEERGRLARELHDDPVQIMTAVSMRLEILRKRVSGEELAAMERLQQTVADAIARLRRMMFELRPLALDDGLASAIDHYVFQHDLLDRGSVRDELETEPSPEARTILYRIAQEALTDIRKHGEGSAFAVTLSERDGGHMLEVREERRGEDPTARSEDSAIGLASMRERAELAGGWFVSDTEPGAGRLLRAWIPGDPQARVL